MTLKEFESILRSKHEVSFAGGPSLHAHEELLSSIIADGLLRVLDPSDEIYSGLQTATLKEGWVGEHAWWLVLDHELLRVRVQKSQFPNDKRIGAKVSIAPYDLRTVAAPVIHIGYVRGLNDRGLVEDFHSAHIAMSVGGEEIDSRAQGKGWLSSAEFCPRAETPDGPRTCVNAPW